MLPEREEKAALPFFSFPTKKNGSIIIIHMKIIKFLGKINGFQFTFRRLFRDHVMLDRPISKFIWPPCSFYITSDTSPLHIRAIPFLVFSFSKERYPNDSRIVFSKLVSLSSFSAWFRLVMDLSDVKLIIFFQNTDVVTAYRMQVA